VGYFLINKGKKWAIKTKIGKYINLDYYTPEEYEMLILEEMS